MPESYDTWDDYIEQYVRGKFKDGSKILDIGPGMGKYGMMFKSHYTVDAVEVFKGYIDQFNLDKIYNKIFLGNAELFEHYDNYDLVIFGDVLEHLTFEKANELLLRIRTSVLVVIPYLYEQGIVHNNVYERHQQSDLTPTIMSERYPYLKELQSDSRSGTYYKEGQRPIAQS